MATLVSEVVISVEHLAEAYFLHPSDHLGFLVSTAFDGIGFGSWKRAMTVALSTKGKFYFIDGSLTKPQPNSPNLKK